MIWLAVVLVLAVIVVFAAFLLTAVVYRVPPEWVDE